MLAPQVMAGGGAPGQPHHAGSRHGSRTLTEWHAGRLAPATAHAPRPIAASRGRHGGTPSLSYTAGHSLMNYDTDISRKIAT
ncbi:hypothetical protein GCM10009579_40370 [Streptomyces javensis]|uniref:Uncharacterized protein n=1 Tax=Streptomyces javensis TaxID=114698 RepID=A0ABP4HSC5_9ACTN